MLNYKNNMDYYKGINPEGKEVIGAHFLDETSGKHFIITKIDGNTLTHIEFFPVDSESVKRCDELGVNFDQDFGDYQIEKLRALKKLAEEDPENAKKYALRNLQRAGILDENGELAYPYNESIKDENTTIVNKL
jgi:hypothetical protein